MDEYVIRIGGTLMAVKVIKRIPCGENNFHLTLREPQTGTLYWRYESDFPLKATGKLLPPLSSDPPG